jgi:hypothetical protein
MMLLAIVMDMVDCHFPQGLTDKFLIQRTFFTLFVMAK